MGIFIEYNEADLFSYIAEYLMFIQLIFLINSQ